MSFWELSYVITHSLIFVRFYWLLCVTWCKITVSYYAIAPSASIYVLWSSFPSRKRNKPSGKRRKDSFKFSSSLLCMEEKQTRFVVKWYWHWKAAGSPNEPFSQWFIKIYHSHKMNQNLAFLEQFLYVLRNLYLFRNSQQKQDRNFVCQQGRAEVSQPVGKISTFEWISRQHNSEDYFQCLSEATLWLLQCCVGKLKLNAFK